MISKIECIIITCDNCEVNYEDTSGFSIWADESSVDPKDDDWYVDGDKHYCPKCYNIDEDGKIFIIPNPKKSKEKIFEILKKIIHEKGFDYEVKPESVFGNDLGIDSLDLVEITMNCDTEFKTNISDEDIESTNTVNDLIEIIHSKQQIN